MRRIALLAPLLLGCAHGGPIARDADVASWQKACAERFKVAQAEAAKKEPGFADGIPVFDQDPRGVRFEVRVPDSFHARSFTGAAGAFVAEVIEQPGNEPGELSPTVGNLDAHDQQVTLGVQKWTRERMAMLEAQVVQSDRARIFKDAFGPAIDDCLK